MDTWLVALLAFLAGTATWAALSAAANATGHTLRQMQRQRYRECMVCHQKLPEVGRDL